MVDAKSGCAMPPKAIRRKNDAMDVFHSFLQTTIPNLPKPTDHARTITMRTDDAKELTSKSARAKCAKIGVTLTNSAGHHKNGIAKVDRFMRTLEGGIRAMIDDAEAPHNEWPAAAARHGEIHNDTPTKGNQGKSPSQVFYGSPPADASKWKPFYCPVFIPKEGKEIRKSWRLENVSLFGYYLGTPPGGRGHLTRKPGHKLAVARKNVLFLEDLDQTLQLRKPEETLRNEEDQLTFREPNPNQEARTPNEPELHCGMCGTPGTAMCDACVMEASQPNDNATVQTDDRNTLDIIMEEKHEPTQNPDPTTPASEFPSPPATPETNTDSQDHSPSSTKSSTPEQPDVEVKDPEREKQARTQNPT
jgi:hypothetical protein